MVKGPWKLSAVLISISDLLSHWRILSLAVSLLFLHMYVITSRTLWGVLGTKAFVCTPFLDYSNGIHSDSTDFPESKEQVQTDAK